MSLCLGIDTSNYTTSAAVYDTDSGKITQLKKLLPVKPGEMGLRQSDAVFHHTVQLPDLMNELLADQNSPICAVGVSTVPRDVEGSYMPCFLAGKAAAVCLSAALKCQIYTFSHQSGHIMAALYSASRLDLLDKPFIAFHVSGGTTDMLYVTGDDERFFKVKLIGSSSDLKAGQAVDRVGVMLGFPFPAGKYVDEAARKSDKKFKVNISVKEGFCSLSGVQNKCEVMLSAGQSAEDICRYCIDSVTAALIKMADYALEYYGDLPIVFSGGVMSNSIIQSELSAKYNAVFAKPEFSCDNAAGVALMCAYKYSDLKG
ncbi:MAG: peptidase M22 [Clostridiales bacterium]|nr:peptidase M22 [Clostridiales bacterium]